MVNAVTLGMANAAEARKYPAVGTYVVAPAGTDAAIRAAALGLAVNGGGIVMLPPGVITLLSPLPVAAGVRYLGSPPILNQKVMTTGAYAADGEWTAAGGTCLVGNGTFAAFEANVTDQGTSSPTNVGSYQITGFGLERIAFSNFTYALHVGAQNLMGLVWGKFDQLYISNCSQWGLKLVNFAHLIIGQISTTLCQNGMYFGTNMDSMVFQPGNTFINELYHMFPRDGRASLRLTRGIVFESISPLTGTAALNEIEVSRMQANDYSRRILSVTAGLVAGSTTVTVPDGTQFLAGMAVVFTTTANGYTANQCYVVASVSGNDLTLSNGRAQTAISAAATANMTLTTYGFPNIEVTASQPLARTAGCKFNHIDTEGLTTVGLYLENFYSSEVVVTTLPATSLIDIVGRNVNQSLIKTQARAKTDFDASSGNSEFRGFRSTTVQRPLRGQWFDASAAASTYCLAIGPGGPAQLGGDLHVRSSQMIYPANGMATHYFYRDTAITLSPSSSGVVTFAGSSAITYTLPTIVTDAILATSNLGMWFQLVNVGSATLTVASSGDQLFNQVASRTTLAVAPASSIRVTAIRDASGRMFWLAVSLTLL